MDLHKPKQLNSKPKQGKGCTGFRIFCTTEKSGKEYTVIMYSVQAYIRVRKCDVFHLMVRYSCSWSVEKS